jgi:hypothetical protein
MSEFSVHDTLLVLAAIAGLTLAGVVVLVIREAGSGAEASAAASVMILGVVGMLVGALLLWVPYPRRAAMRARRRRGHPRDLV